MGKQGKTVGRLRLDSGHHRRILAVALVLGLVAFGPVAIRLYQLMVVRQEEYRQKALDNQSRSTAVTADRGTIYDRNLEILAQSVTVENVYLDPQELRQSQADLEALSRELGRILDRDPQWILSRARDRTKRYHLIASRIDESLGGEVREYIRRSGISGIHLEPNSQRFYPNGTLAAQVLGFTNTSNQGSEGIEAAYDSFLAGSAGRVVTTKGNNEMDMPFSYEAYLGGTAGCDLILTLDATVQRCLEKALRSAMNQYQVENGAFGLVMNAKTGEILAMATLGSFDPNAYLEIADSGTAGELARLRADYLARSPGTQAYTAGENAYRKALSQAQLKQWRNRVISDGYEPGSTFKVLTMAAALDTGAIDLDTGFYCRGAEQIPGRAQLLHCWRAAGHGSETTPQALQNSCNIAFAHIALKLGGARFYDYIEKFGILEKTGIDLAGESKGIFFDKALVTNTEKWGTASLTSGSFGQTFKITPLQLVRAIASVVNGGKLLEPYLVAEAVDARGNTVFRQEPTVIRQTISQETSRTMCRLLQSVVEEGTAKNAQVAGFSVGGKTGTSEKIDVFDENGQRVQDKIVSFVGIAPMDDPQYIVLAALDTPSRSTGIYISGGVMAAPTVGAVLGDILPYLGVEKEDTTQVILEDYLGRTLAEAKAGAEAQGLAVQTLGAGDRVTAQIPQAGEDLPAGSQVLLYFGQAQIPETVTVPQFVGLDRLAARKLALERGLYLESRGNESVTGVEVTEQSLPAGTVVPWGSTITLRFTDTKAVDG